MRGNKFFAKKVYIVPGSNHRFRTEHDAKFYCQQRGIDFDTVEKYDSAPSTMPSSTASNVA